VNPSSPSPTSIARIPWWGRLSTLWLLLVPVCTAIYTLLLPIAPNDFWYHVRAGAEIVASGRIPREALFSASVPPHTPYFYQSWAAEIALFQTLRIGGLAGIVVLRTLILTLSFALLQWCAWRRAQRIAPDSSATQRARLVALSTLLAFALCASNMDVRPQTFSVPLFCLFAFALYEWAFLTARQRALAVTILAALMLLWANTHGAFVTGLVLLIVFVAGEVFTSCFWRPSLVKRFGGKLAPPPLRAALLLLCACGVATLSNPRGAGIYVYVRLLAQFEANQKFIQEWQAPNVRDWYGALFFLSLFLFALLLGVLARRGKAAVWAPEGGALLGVFGVRFSELLILAALIMMALRDARSIIWFGLFSAPPIVALLCRCFAGSDHSQEEPVPRSIQIINAIIALLLISSCIPLLPWLKPGLPMPPEYLKHFAPNPEGHFPIGFSADPLLLLEHDTPVKAVAFLRTNPPRGKIWNDFVYGSYLAWVTLYEPRLAPHADPRVEMHPLAFWEEYGRIAAGATDAARTLAAQGFTDALLDAREEPGLAQKLRAAGWRVVFPQSTLCGKGALLLRRPLKSQRNVAE
jgi:hypothetical protein